MLLSIILYDLAMLIIMSTFAAKSEIMTKILLAIDSFKGCLSSSEVEEAVAKAILMKGESYEILKIPVSDGGEGMLEAFCHAINGEIRNVRVHDPLMRVVSSSYGVSSDHKIAIIEMARASGLMFLDHSELNPMLTTSYGTGELIADAILHGCRNFIIGLGGSATCDGGTGMMQALGVRFFDSDHHELMYGGAILPDIKELDISQVNPLLSKCTFTIAADVFNPLCGDMGAAKIFAPQKGATAAMVDSLEKGLHNYSEIVNFFLHKDVNVVSAGAAGGLGASLIGFMNAKVCSGTDLLLKLINFDRLLSDSDLVITGEGRADRQTLMGKLPFGILQAGKRQKKPVYLMAGNVEDLSELSNAGFEKIIAITPDGMPLSQAMEKDVAIKNIVKAVGQLL